MDIGIKGDEWALSMVNNDFGESPSVVEINMDEDGHQHNIVPVADRTNPQTVGLTIPEVMEEDIRVWKGGGPDPAFPLLFHANPASRTFCHRFPESRFSFLRNSFKKGLIFA